MLMGWRVGISGTVASIQARSSEQKNPEEPPTLLGKPRTTYLLKPQPAIVSLSFITETCKTLDIPILGSKTPNFKHGGSSSKRPPNVLVS